MVRPAPSRASARVPWAALAAAGGFAFAGIRLAQAARGPWLEPGRGGTTYDSAPILLALFVPYGLALLAYRRGSRPRAGVILTAGAALHVVLAFVPPTGSQDLFQYLFYGKMVAVHAANPYLLEPARFAADPWFGFITWRTQTSVYGPVWTLLSAGVVRAAGSGLLASFAGMKAAVLLIDAGIMALLLAVGRDLEGGPGFGLLAWSLNPMVWIAVPVEGHADVAVGAAFLLAVLARRRGHPLVGTGAFALAALVKPYAGLGLLLPLVLIGRQRGWRPAARHAAAAAALGAMLYLPWLSGLRTFGGAGEVARRFGGTSLTGALYRLITWSGPGVRAHPGPVGVAILAGAAAFVVAVVVVAARRLRDESGLWEGIVLVFGAYLLATPWFFYWHLIPLVVLACALPRLRSSPAVLVGSATGLVAFRLPAYEVGLVLQTAARYGPPLAVQAARSPR